MKLTIEQRNTFFNQEYFKISANNVCWRWIGSHDNHGYGRYVFEGKPVAAHRFMYEYKFGPVPKGEFVHHKCPNRDCVNPKHLWAGTMKDYRDYIEEFGETRQPHGSKVKISKLKESDIPEIKRLRAEGMSQAKIAALFGVSQVTISNILSGKVWFYA